MVEQQFSIFIVFVDLKKAFIMDVRRNFSRGRERSIFC